MPNEPKAEGLVERAETQIKRLRGVIDRLLLGERLIMRVPADVDHDMDLIIAQAIDRLRELAAAHEAMAQRAMEAENALFTLRNKAGCGPDQSGPDIWQQRDALAAENARLREALLWFIENDETNEGDTPLPEHGGKTWNEINAYWIDGLRKAKAALAGQETNDVA
jgi:hypothetical protein